MEKDEPIDHQFSLFGYQPPSGKVPISAEKIREAKELFKNGHTKASAEKLREVREALERFEGRISNKKK
jgi:hypothetical protein